MILVDFHVFISPFSPFDRLRIYSKHLRHLQTLVKSTSLSAMVSTLFSVFGSVV